MNLNFDYSNITSFHVESLLGFCHDILTTIIYTIMKTHVLITIEKIKQALMFIHVNLNHAIVINQDAFLNWFGIKGEALIQYEADIKQCIKEGGNLANLELKSVSLFKISTLQLLLKGFLHQYRTGFCTADLDRLVTLVLCIRFVILSIRYNIRTACIITLICMASSWLWYKRFLLFVFHHSQLLYNVKFFHKFGLDAKELSFIMKTEMKRNTYRIRLSNPAAVVLHVYERSTVIDGYRIDPISMIVSKLPTTFGIYDKAECFYYLFYRKILPAIDRFIRDFYRNAHSLMTYTYIARMNRKYCPYHFRWHWTAYIIISSGPDRIWIHLFNRMEYYTIHQLGVRIARLERFYQKYQYTNKSYLLIDIKRQLDNLEFETKFIDAFALTMIASSLLFSLFMLLHSLCGQYVYIPIVTDSVEMHVGKRDKLSKYSGGLTAWQDRKGEQRGSAQIWYGWFGRGTKGKSNVIFDIIWYILRFGKRLLLSILAVIMYICRLIIRKLSNKDNSNTNNSNESLYKEGNEKTNES
uniref:Uncharacterized protein n=1 Tax=Astrosyne radiata TaxID=1158023 RepID=A0A2U9NTB2_9STRA|nr:hypothetical protein ycf90 [Astrosyne radiata]AWT40275.1 hypothetical protein ycf90 [Astrosyne radiata]